jgi:hypothetical protein
MSTKTDDTILSLDLYLSNKSCTKLRNQDFNKDLDFLTTCKQISFLYLNENPIFSKREITLESV